MQVIGETGRQQVLKIQHSPETIRKSARRFWDYSPDLNAVYCRVGKLSYVSEVTNVSLSRGSYLS